MLFSSYFIYHLCNVTKRLLQRFVSRSCEFVFLLEHGAFLWSNGTVLPRGSVELCSGRAALTPWPWVCPFWLSMAVPAASTLCPEHPVLALGSGAEMQHFELQLWVTLSTGAEVSKGTRAAHWQG